VLRVLPAVKTKSDVGSPSAKTQTWPGVTVSGANNVPESAHPQVGFGHSCPVRSVHYSRCAATDSLSPSCSIAWSKHAATARSMTSTRIEIGRTSDGAWAHHPAFATAVRARDAAFP
jgi:hypothetical protein